MLALSHQQGLLPYSVCLVAALSVQEVLLEVPIHGCREQTDNLKQTQSHWCQTRRKWAGVGNSLLLGTGSYFISCFIVTLSQVVLINIHLIVRILRELQYSILPQ